MSVPFASVVAVAEMVAPFTAVAVTAAANPAGAAWTEFAETAPAMIALESVTPRLLKIFRSRFIVR